jgi:opacity protein-like surface antigen
MMTSKSNKSRWGVAALATLTMAAVLASPQAAAHKKKKHSAKKHHSTTTQTYSRHSSYSHSSAGNSRVDALEQRLLSMQAELDALRGQQASGGVADPQTTAKVQELEQWMADSKAKPEKEKKNMVYFRGGFARNDQQPIATTSNLSCADGITGPVGCTSSDKNGWNFGAGFDFSLSDDMFGLMHNTELLAELDVDYVELGKFTGNVTGAISIPKSAATATQSQLRLTAAPKIKFFQGSKLRPWIIPAGFTMNVMSPPSQLNTITELMPAIHFGGGVDYNIWKNLYIGTDVRYNWALNKLDGTNTNGLTAGGYLGIGF